MSKPKKEEFITGTSRDPASKLIVQKSTPLTALWRSDMTLAEFKLLDTYLARINTHDPSKRSVRFNRGEIEQLLGIKKINVSDLQKRVCHLMQPLILSDGPNDFRGISLFEEASCHADEYGVWTVDLRCSEAAIKYFFNIENLGYLRYKLRCVSELTSRYSYILFVYLEANRFRQSWEIGFDDLKHLLRCDSEPTYNQFYRFNDRLLKRCYIELTQKTDCKFSYQPIRRGRTVVAIRFTLETLANLQPGDPLQLDLLNSSANEDNIEFLRGACQKSNEPEPEFSYEEIAALYELISTIPEEKFPAHVPTGDLSFRQYHYLAYRYAEMNRKDTKRKPIKNRYAYLSKMIKTDAGIS